MVDQRPVYVHIGLQKTGTSFLQSIFWGNKPDLAAQGLDLVPGSPKGTFVLRLAVLDQKDARFTDGRVESAHERLTEQLADAPGDRALITEESLAAATVEQAQRLVAACGDREVHLLVTVRDVARALPSAWMQRLRGGGDESFEDYVARVIASEEDIPPFRVNHDLNDVLDRWEQAVPPERVHVITVPPASAPREELLHRFCGFLGVDPARLRQERVDANESLGRVDAEVLRRVNLRLPPEDKWRFVYGNVGKRWFAQKVLGHAGGGRALVPQSARAWCDDHAEAVIARLRDYDVTGDLGDLRPLDPSFAPDGHGLPDEAAVSEAAFDALAFILRERMEDLRRENEARQAQQEAAAVETVEQERPARGLLRWWRR